MPAVASMPPIERAEHLVDRARVALDRRLLLHVPHHDVERVRARDHHRRDGRGIVGALVVVDRDQAVHERARGDERHVAERAGAHLLLGAEPLAAEALGVADDRVELGVGDRLEHARRLREVGRQRLLDQHGDAALDRRHDRIDMQVLVGGDDRAGDLGPLEQLDVALGDEIGADLGRDLAGAVRVLLGDADPLHRRMAVRHLAAEQPDAAAADDREADVLRRRPHTLSPLRNLALKSATAAMVSLVSGRSTGSLRSAERSAAV